MIDQQAEAAQIFRPASKKVCFLCEVFLSYSSYERFVDYVSRL